MVSLANFTLIATTIKQNHDSLQRAENYFPIESFVMITQDLVTFQEICDSDLVVT